MRKCNGTIKSFEPFAEKALCSLLFWGFSWQNLSFLGSRVYRVRLKNPLNM